jgi:hypothetical protein
MYLLPLGYEVLREVILRIQDFLGYGAESLEKERRLALTQRHTLTP